MRPRRRPPAVDETADHRADRRRRPHPPATPGRHVQRARAHSGRPIVKHRSRGPRRPSARRWRAAGCARRRRAARRPPPPAAARSRSRARRARARVAATAPATSVASACRPIAQGAPTSVTVAPASAGPMMNAESNEIESAAFAWFQSGRGTATGISERKPTVGIGKVAPRPPSSSRSTAAGACRSWPQPTTANSSAARRSWVATMPRTRAWVRSSHAPTKGPVRIPGRSCAAAPAPAIAGLSGRLEQVDDDAHLAHRVGQPRERDRRDQRRVAGHPRAVLGSPRTRPSPPSAASCQREPHCRGGRPDNLAA